MEDLCRLCLQRDESLTSVFEYRDDVLIADVIENICAIRIVAEDLHPKEICRNCRDILYKAHDLRVLSLRNDFILKGQDASYNFEVKMEHSIDIGTDDMIKFEPSPSIEPNSEDELMMEYSGNTFDIVEVSIDHTAQSEYQEERYQCDQCSEIETSKKAILLHIENEHLTDNICSICSKQFNSSTILKQHMRRKHGADESITCDQCNLSFKSPRKLAKHQEIHLHFVEEAGEDLSRKYNCLLCSKKFDDYDDKLLVHIQYHKKHEKRKSYEKQANSKRTREEFESLICPQCGQIYRTKQILQQHIKRHFEHYAYACPKCPQKFKSWGELYYHNAVHTTERNFVCEICSKAFKAKRDLRNHKIRHETKNIKKFQCPYCQLMLKNKYTLNRHILIHTGEVRNVSTANNIYYILTRTETS